ncbi:hypothetical protein LOZ53_005039 [Ophidiomyces ophidiicola]|nr:hypothetical protein LOZ61_006565 [Ophidiomyces ophidiicola]KAI1926175.1 hypothetical protein LOZ60_003745 [Ophidiomyces ophidiicola]KAI1973233.1 hypothetical protein LOZ55_005518 [Ophidiomyces ophidiicola]KAI1985533.1 hypothetical protein LOZ53_005039 [Ophidiomyces ophidiicola]KAI1989931.1 hypothetical protein LOZ54_002726 [Ophidiomyces ophidiicola]
MTSSPTQPAANSSPQPAEDPYQQLHSYPFSTDTEFKLGLAMILRQPGTPATEEQINRTDDLVLRAKCFYYSRKQSIQPPLDFLAYKTWLQSHAEALSEDPAASAEPSSTETSTGPAVSEPPTTTVTSQEAPAATSSSPSTQEQPAYPSSFAHIVELITTGQPIPGIQQIPDTLLTGQEGPSTATRRLKPWELQEEKNSQTGNGESDSKEKPVEVNSQGAV